MLQQVDVDVVSGSARQQRRPRVHREARAQHARAGVGLDVGAAIIEVLNRHTESELNALISESFERELVKTLAGNSAVGDRRRGAQHLGGPVADTPSTPAVGHRGLERVRHEIVETPRTVCAAQRLAGIDEQDPRGVRQARVQQCHREREPREPRTRDEHVGIEGGLLVRLSHTKLLTDGHQRTDSTERRRSDVASAGYTVNSSPIVNISRCGTRRGLALCRDHARFPGATPSATPPPYRQWPDWARQQHISAFRRRRRPLPC